MSQKQMASILLCNTLLWQRPREQAGRITGSNEKQNQAEDGLERNTTTN